MLFNSGTFLIFLFLYLGCFFLTRQSIRGRNWLILGASYLFYAWWDWRFLILLVGSSLLDYKIGQWMEKTSTPSARRQWLAISLAVNLGTLGIFKYFHFVADSFQDLANWIGLSLEMPILQIVLPVGISFYTFQSLSYSMDVYRRKILPVEDPVAFLAYVSFFPQLVAGPIERATHLLPQFLSTRTISRDHIQNGLWLITAGMFKKVVLADNLGQLADMVFSDGNSVGIMVALGTIAFGFQIYCDFSGYSDIARGVASLLGFELMVNFNLPYFARTPSEFWQRWHISLSTWFRDYVYIPLGGNRGTSMATMKNLLITMMIAGLWHGAGWNFVFWGLWHGLWLCIMREKQPQTLISSVLSWGITMGIVFYGWLLFRAQSLDQIISLTQSLFSTQKPSFLGYYSLSLVTFMAPLVFLQCFQRFGGNLPKVFDSFPPIKMATMALAIWLIGIYWKQEGSPFIYFQF